MSRWVEVRNRSRAGARIVRARWCDAFFCRLRGLSFRRSFPESEGLLLVESAPTRLGAAIHMWGVFFPLGVAWLDEDRRVVHLQHARPWRVYLPPASARYVLEAAPSMLATVSVGDVMEFIDEAVG